MNVAVVGLGFMGATHAKAWQRIPGARLSAVVSADDRKLAGDLTAIGGNLGGAGERLDFSDVRKYRAFDAALADPGIDAFDICLPTHRHADAALLALRAGRHVLVEKPLALHYRDACELIEEAERSGRILMAGQVLRFIPAYAELARRIAGPVHSALFRRRCAAPAWSEWLGDPARSGGGPFDLLIHDADYCISLWGMPDAVRAVGSVDSNAGVDVMNAELEYPGTGPVLITGGWHHRKAYRFSMEFTVVTGAGTFDWPGSGALRHYTPAGDTVEFTLPEADPFIAELAYFADCVRGNRRPEFCPPEQSAAAVALLRLMLESREAKGERVLCRL